MKNYLKTGIALVALSVIAMGAMPASAQDAHHRSNRNRGRGHNDVDIHFDFGRRDNYRSRRYDDYYYRDSHGRSDYHGGSNYRYEPPRHQSRRYDDHYDPHHR